MATGYGGQMANAFTQGLTQGYGAVDTAVTNKQNRENNQRVADQQSKIMEQTIRARNAIETETQGATAINAETQKKMAEMEKGQKSTNANLGSVAVNNIIASSNKEGSAEAVANANTLIKNNPSLAKTFGFKEGEQIEELNLDIDTDLQEYGKSLAQKGVTASTFGLDIEDPEEAEKWKLIQQNLLDVTSNVKVGSAFIDLDNLGAGMNSSSRATVKQKKDMEANLTKQKNVVKKHQHEQFDSKLVTMSEKLKAVGINLDTTNLKTVEQKQKALEDGEQKLYNSAFTTVTDEEASIGVKSAEVPKTLVMGEDGEFVEATASDLKTANVTKAADGVITSKLADGSTMEQKPLGEGKTETTIDGKTTVTKDQTIGKDATAPENKEQVEQSLMTDKPMDENRMRHLYALAGMTYPIPDKTALAKNFEFMKANSTMTDSEVLDRLKPLTTAASTPLIKTMKERANYKKGSAEYKDLTEQINKLNHIKTTIKDRKPTSYEDASKAFILGKDSKPTKEEWVQFNADWATKSTGGVKDVRDQRDLAELNRNFSDVQSFKDSYLTNPNKATSTDLGLMKHIEQSNLQNSPAIKERTKDTIKDMELRHRTVNGLDSLIADLNGTIQNSTRGPIEGMMQSAKKIIGADNLSAEEADKMRSTIERDTRTGMILAEFLRMTSGLAVTEDERKFLTDVMTGGNWSDEKSLLKALKSFRNQTAEQNDIIAGTLINDAPYSATIYRQYDTYEKANSQKKPKVVAPSENKLNIKDFM